jgi:hypothetical protein
MELLLTVEGAPSRRAGEANEPNPLPGLPSAAQGERIEWQLLRGSERDLELEGDTRHRVERVVPGLGWDA